MNQKLENIDKTAGRAEVIMGDTHDEVKRQGETLYKMEDGLHDI